MIGNLKKITLAQTSNRKIKNIKHEYDTIFTCILLSKILQLELG